MRALVLLLVALAPMAARADAFVLGRSLNGPLVAEVFASAFSFMRPRTLQPVPIPTLAMWALGGLTTLDGRLRPEMVDGRLRLVLQGAVLASAVPPPADDARRWGAAVATLVRAGWQASEPVRRAGTQRIVQALFDELCSHLDPYSRYAPPAMADTDRVHRRGVAGIGARAVARDGGFVLRDISPEGPTAAAGVREGEQLLAVDGQTLEGASPATVTGLLAGPEGTEVVLMLRGKRGRVRNVGVERMLVPPRTVVVARRGDVLVLHVTGFAIDTGAQLAGALTDALASRHPPRGVVIDLRGNRGGLLRQAVAAAETLLANGVVARTAGRDPDARHSFVAHGIDLAAGLPAVVMVDGYSASSAEILAAALADQHRAVVVGSATFGKGLVQTIAPLPDGGELFVSWSRVLAPLGWPLQGLGVLPQVCTSLGAAALSRQLALLARGVQPMAAVLARDRATRPPLSPTEILEIRDTCPSAAGSTLDLIAAHRLIHSPRAYATALLGPPPARLATAAGAAP